MHELPGLGRVAGIEAQRAAIRVSVAVANGPGSVVALVIALEVAVAINEITGGVAELFQRAENFRDWPWTSWKA